MRLAGEGGPRENPHVDPATGDIVLYRFPGALGAYEAPLAHELVHAIRFSIWTTPERQTDAGLFWEEGFAEPEATRECLAREHRLHAETKSTVDHPVAFDRGMVAIGLDYEREEVAEVDAAGALKVREQALARAAQADVHVGSDRRRAPAESAPERENPRNGERSEGLFRRRDWG